ncbi:MAG: non-specific endonuclease [Blastocatellia bacterium]|jgi:hypothetical protein|nr:non-specific endonuclease [Blastocatellia bacterium]
MNTFAQKTSENASRDNAGGFADKERNVSPTLQLSDAGAAVNESPLRESLNRSSKVQAQLQLQQMFDQSSRVTAQRKLAATLSARKSAQQPQPTLQLEEAIAGEEEEPLQEKLAPLQRKEMAEAPLQLQPEGRYRNSTPASDGFKWDTAETTDDGGETVPEKLIAVMKNPGDGGVPSVDPPGWNWLRRKLGRLKGQWVRFHLINAQLGGPGNDTENLVPTTNALNQNGNWRRLEDAAKESALDDEDWTYLEVNVGYDDDYPAGIPASINANWGYWKEADSDGSEDDMEDESEWVRVSSVALAQANPDDDEEEVNYMFASQVTQGMLRGYGLSVQQAVAAKELIDDTWDDQNEFDEAWDDVEDIPHNRFWAFAHGHMYVDEDEDIDGPYGVVVKKN